MTELAALAQPVAALLSARKQTISIAESSTGGLISAALLAVPGASAYFVAGSVVYTAASRRILLDVHRDAVANLAPLSEPMAAHFARVARERLGATWGIAELGSAGPTGTRYGHPAGLTAIAIDGPVQLARIIRTGSSDREANMWAFARAALALCEEALRTQAPG